MTPPHDRAPARLPLTVCMIVRNEADNLGAALASVRGIAREVVVVDTGSTDGTVAVALAHGARVLHFAWVDDFARARNVALAAATSDWILSLDADQRLPPASVPALARAVGRSDCPAQIVTIEIRASSDGSPTTPDARYAALRLMRRDPRIRYTGRVHEDIADALMTLGGGRWPDSGVTLSDIGYADAGDRQRKRERNLALLRLSHAEHPDALYVAYKLAITLPDEAAGVAGSERRTVLATAWQGLRRLHEPEAASLPFLPRLAALVADDLAAQGRLMEAVELLRALQPVLGGTLDFALGVASARAGLADAAREMLGYFMVFIERSPDLVILGDDAAHPALACRWLAWLDRQQGAAESAVTWLERARAVAAAGHRIDIDCESVELQLATGDLGGAAAALDRIAVLARDEPSGVPRLMRVSAMLARATGDVATALELARAAAEPGDDDGAVLLATLEIEAGPLAEARLRHHHAAIAGRRFDTLAVKLLIGDSLGIPWPHPVPDATGEALRALRGD